MERGIYGVVVGWRWKRDVRREGVTGEGGEGKLPRGAGEGAVVIE